MARTVAALAFLMAPAIASADAVKFGPHDVASVFHIAKSENHNEVHFGVRLDASCRLIGDRPVFAYWREREVSESATSELLFLERPAYDVGAVEMEAPDRARIALRALPERKIEIEVTKGSDGGCVALAYVDVAGEPSRLRRVFAMLSTWSIDYVIIQAERLRDGSRIDERVSP